MQKLLNIEYKKIFIFDKYNKKPERLFSLNSFKLLNKYVNLLWCTFILVYPRKKL